jgi:hypothetical protein
MLPDVQTASFKENEGDLLIARVTTAERRRRSFNFVAMCRVNDHDHRRYHRDHDRPQIPESTKNIVMHVVPVRFRAKEKVPIRHQNERERLTLFDYFDDHACVRIRCVIVVWR